MTEKDISEIINQCIDNQRSAQKRLYDFLAPRMFSLCLRYTGDRMIAEDVLQDGFVTLFSKLSTYKNEGSFDGWARRIFVNTALMHLRKKDALKISDDIDNAFNLKAETVSQTQNLAYKDLIKMITDLPDGFRTVFNLYVIEGYSHKEIGQMLQISENTSRTQLSRARLSLQKKIKELK